MIKKEIDWEQRRYEIAKAALIGELASPVIEPSTDCVCKRAVKIADTLIEKLKEGNQ